MLSGTRRWCSYPQPRFVSPLEARREELDADRCLDSGGPGTYSQALILKEIENKIINRASGSNSNGLIHEHFDLIGGVGFGG